MVSDLPPSNRGLPRKWVTILEPLMKHPGKWARVTSESTKVSCKNMVTSIQNRQVILPPGRWQAALRAGVAYVRYLGP